MLENKVVLDYFMCENIKIDDGQFSVPINESEKREDGTFSDPTVPFI